MRTFYCSAADVSSGRIWICLSTFRKSIFPTSTRLDPRDISLWDDIKEVGCKINDGKGWSSFGNDGFFVRRNISNSSRDQRRQQSAMDVDAQVTGAVAAQTFELDLNSFSTATYYPAAYQRKVGQSTTVVNASC